MARNTDRDEREAERRKLQLIKAGFDLFSTCGIEAVSMQTVADHADVGAATMYKYFQNKTNLLVAISAAVWAQILSQRDEMASDAEVRRMNAYELVEFYADAIIRLYRERPEVLRFSGNYKTFVNREGVTDERLKIQLDVLQPIEVLFHEKYEQARIDGSIRTDIPEQEMFTTITLTMLGMAERYAQGIVWANDHRTEHTVQLVHQKEMLLLWVRAGQGI